MEFNAKEISREAIVELLGKWYAEGKLTSLAAISAGKRRYEAEKLKVEGKLLSLYAEGIYTTDEEVRKTFNALWKEMRIFKKNVLESDADLTTIYAINKQVKIGAVARFEKLGKLHFLYID